MVRLGCTTKTTFLISTVKYPLRIISEFSSTFQGIFAMFEASDLIFENLCSRASKVRESGLEKSEFLSSNPSSRLEAC